MNYLVRFLIVSLFITWSFSPNYVFSQVTRNNLINLLPSADQNKFRKAEVTFNKGKTIEDEAAKLNSPGQSDKETAKNQKKFSLNRLEASQYYQSSNYDTYNLLKEKINKFWKSYKGNLNQLSIIKNKEDQANELFRSAKSLRKVAEDLVYPEEKLVKILEAEKDEKECIDIQCKALYAYLNIPEEYDHLIATTDTLKKIDENEPVILSKENPIPITPSETVKKDTASLSYPMQQTVKKDTNLILQSKVPDTKTETKKPTPVSLNQDLKKDTTVISRSIQKENVPGKSSLYGAVNVNEDQIDKFNKFLQTKYPKDYENYIINFQSLDYSNIDSLRSAWDTYLASRREHPNMNEAGPENEDSLLIAQAKQKHRDNKLSENQDKSRQKTKSKHKESPTKITTVPEEPATGFVFKVQIAACRIQMNAQSLKQIYKGTLPIIELNEENWYKYTIGEFNTYKKARTLRNSVKVPGAFVIAYLNGKRIKITLPMTKNGKH